jgi:hypothetical protein
MADLECPGSLLQETLNVMFPCLIFVITQFKMKIGIHLVMDLKNSLNYASQNTVPANLSMWEEQYSTVTLWAT